MVTIIGAPTLETVADAFDNAWTFSAACLLGAGLGCLAVRRLRPEQAAEAPSLASAARLVLTADASRAPTPQPRPAPRAPVAPELADSLPKRPETIADFLAKATIFAPLSAPMLESLAAQAEPVRLSAGEWLFREGDEGDSLYVVQAGRLEVVSEQADRILRVLGRGSALGELALLTSSPRSASVRAARDTSLISISRDDFDRLLTEAPEIALAIARVLGRQLQDSEGAPQRSRAVPSTIALVALDGRAPVRELAAGLAEALGRWGTTAMLDGSEVGAGGHDRADPAATYAPLLDRAESLHDQLVLCAGSPFEPDPWTAYCLQHADRILAVGGGEAGPPAGTRPELRGCDLVAWEVERGSGALAAWAESLQPIETHALARATLDADLARTARRLAGHSLGIVLSGGGARAFAHIGVLEELVAAGVVIDRVAGVSMGAYVGALFALGLSGDEIDARCYEEWVRRRPLGDYTVPRHALIRGERARGMLERSFGSIAIEELATSFCSGASELRSGELVLSRSGPLLEAVGTSLCIPILAPPQVRGRALLVDGSLVDNLPVEAMASLGEGPIIAVDVKASFERPPAKNGAGPRASAGDERPPSLGETLTRVLLLGSSNTSESARRHAQVTIKPRGEGVGLLEFHQLDEAREAGRLAAREALEQASGTLFQKA